MKITLNSFNGSRKIPAIKAVRSLDPSIGLREALEISNKVEAGDPQTLTISGDRAETERVLQEGSWLYTVQPSEVDDLISKLSRMDPYLTVTQILGVLRGIA